MGVYPLFSVNDGFVELLREFHSFIEQILRESGCSFFLGGGNTAMLEGILQHRQNSLGLTPTDRGNCTRKARGTSDYFRSRTVSCNSRTA